MDAWMTGQWLPPPPRVDMGHPDDTPPRPPHPRLTRDALQEALPHQLLESIGPLHHHIALWADTAGGGGGGSSSSRWVQVPAVGQPST